MARQPLSREFRKRMLRDAALCFLGLIVVMALLGAVLKGKQFLIAALVIVPATSLSFNLMARRAYAAEMAGKR